MATVSACAGRVRATVEAAEQTAATVSAARRADFLLGNGIPPGTYVSAGTRWNEMERAERGRARWSESSEVEQGGTRWNRGSNEGGNKRESERGARTRGATTGGAEHDARRSPVHRCPVDFYARQSPAWSR